MPHQETSHRFQDAVLWPREGRDDYGEPTVGEPVAVRVRWTYGRTLMRDRDGNPVEVDATVMLDRDVTTESVMWLGKLADWFDDGVQELMEVKAFDRVSDVKNRGVCRVAGLVRFKGTLPESA